MSEAENSTERPKQAKKTILLEIPGEPQSQQRHRHFNRGGFVQTYDPQSKIKNLIRQKLDKTFLESPLRISCTFIFKAAHPRQLWLPCQNVKDLDNLEKFVFDTLAGVMFVNDKQIFKTKSRKCYALEAKTIIEITPVDMLELNKIFDKITPYQFYDLYVLAGKLVQFYETNPEVNPSHPEYEGLTIAQHEVLATLLLELAEYHPILKKINQVNKC